MGNNRRRHRFAGLLLTVALLMTALYGCGSARRDMAQEEQEEQGAKDIQDVQETREEQSKPITMADMIGESEIGQERKEKNASDLPDTILWFNATYAPLTYSNGWNWRLVGGLEPTEENIEITEMLQQSSWSVKDRAGDGEESDLKGPSGKMPGLHRADGRVRWSRSIWWLGSFAE